MAVLQKRLQKQDLTNIETFVVDNTTESIYFNVVDVEDVVPGGKSTIQILGSEYLVPDAEIKIELLDSTGNPVFVEAIKYLGDKPSRHISIEVYGNTPNGIGKLTILGSAERLVDGTEIPEEWEGLYNVKWERNVFIDPTEKNLEKIIFKGEAVGFGKRDRYRLPSLEISEQIRGVVVASGSGNTPTGFVTQSTFTGGKYEANASPFGAFVNIEDLDNETEEGISFDLPDYVIEPSINSYSTQPDIISDDGLATGLGGTGNELDDNLYENFHGNSARPFPPEEDFPVVRESIPPRPIIPPDPNFTGQGTLIKRTSGDVFRSEFAGGLFRAEPSVNFERVKNVTGQAFLSSSFTASIIAVHSPDLLEIDRPYTIESLRTKDNGKRFKVPHQATSFKIDFRPSGQTQDSGSGESKTIFRSFAEITIKNMKTFSGDVHRVKTYTKGYANSIPFTLVGDRLVESSDVLNDRSSPTLSQKIGVFKNQNHLDKYWVLKRKSLGSRFPNIGSAVSGTISFGDTTSPPMMNGVHISGSNGAADETIVFETKLSNIKIRPDVDYELRLRPVLKVGEKDILQPDGSVLRQAKAKVRFYISGSKINQDNTEFPTSNEFGDPIKVTKTVDENYGNVITLESGKSDNSVGKLVDFSVVKIPFRPSFDRNVLVNDDTKLQIEVESGELHLGRVELVPANDTNFSPDEFTFVTAMPRLRARPDIFDFRLEFLNRDGKKSDYIAFKNTIQFEGENEVIQGGDNLLTGSLFIGNTIGQGVEIGGGNSAFIRSIGYHGFSSASMNTTGTGSGFMMFSGSVLPNLSSSDNYRGIGLELHDGDDSFFQYRTEVGSSSGSLFKVQSKDFFFGKSGSNGAFISGSGGKIEISSSQFHVDTAGNISASNLHIAGGTITGSLVIGSSVTVDAATANSIRVPTGGPPFKAEILSDGYARFTTGSIASINIDSNALFTTGSNSYYISGSAAGIPTQGGRQNNFISASKFQVSALGNLTASNVLITGGKITGDVDVQGTFSANSIEVPTSGDVLAEITTAGYARFVSASIGGFAVNETQMKSFDDKLILSSSGGITGSDVFFSGGRIGGWEIGSDKISSNNLIISSSGDIQSANYISDFSGFRLSTFKNGFLEVDEAKIRGTLRTTVFEKETVNAVGGQLWVANSTTISGSDVGVGKSTTSMSVANVSGFKDGEIALIKKTTQTGFSSEYVRINSSSISFPDNDENLSGLLFVSRSWGRLSQSIDTTTAHGLGALSSSITELPGTGSSYTDGQVIVSTGRVNTGYIRLNANPSDTFTPYMDIIERTGSGIFDTELKVRIGDLSGLFGKIEGASVSGFGLATDNVFLTGSFFAGSSLEHISFQTGSFEAKLKKFNLDTTGLKIQGESTGTSNKILLGSATAIGSGTGVYLDGGGNFRAGGASSNFVKFDGSTLDVSGRITITAGALAGVTTSSLAAGSGSIAGLLGTATGSLSSSIGAKINPFETQVVLDSGGMSLRKDDGTIVADYGVVTELFKNGDTDEKAILGATGLSIVQGGVTQSRFGSDVIVGKDVTNKSALRITDAGVLSIGKKSATPNFQVDAGGNVTMTGGITITGGGVQDVFDKIAADSSSLSSSVEKHNLSTGSLSGSIGTQVNPFKTQVVLDTSGMSLRKTDGTVLADYGVVTELYQNGDTDEKAILGSSGLAIIQGGVTQSRFGEDVIVGKHSTSKTALRITDAGALSIGKKDATPNFSVDASGNVTTTGAITITGGGAQTVFNKIGADSSSLFTSASQAKSSASFAASGSQTFATANTSSSLAGFKLPLQTQIELTSAGMNLKNQANNKTLASYGVVTELFKDGSADNKAILGGDGLVVVQGGVTSSIFGDSVELRSATIASKTTASLDTNAFIFLKGGVTQSKFGVGEATIGVTTGSHFEVSGSGLRLKDGNVPRFAVDANGVKVGNTSTSGFATQSFIDIDTFGVNFVKDGNSVGLFGEASLRLGATGLGLSQIELNASGDNPGTIFKDSDGKIVATIGTATETSGGTFGGGSRVIPQTGAIRGMIVENIATNQAIVTGSISGSNLIIEEINVTGSTSVALNAFGSVNAGGVVVSGSVRNTSNGNATSVLIHAKNNTQTLFQVLTDGEVLARDNITAFNTSGFSSISDKRLKTNIQPISQSLNKILKLEPKNFSWIENNEKDSGFIAQDVEKVIPEVVQETKGFVDIDSNETEDTKYKTIAYSKLTIYLVDAIKELTKRVEELEKENKILRLD